MCIKIRLFRANFFRREAATVNNTQVYIKLNAFNLSSFQNIKVMENKKIIKM
jgi:hypothetical protein